MVRAPSFAGVILAAGASSRMGTDKALLPWPPRTIGAAGSHETFLSAAIQMLTRATDFVLVVSGENQASLAPVTYAEGAAMVVNPDSGRGQFSSMQVGLREVLDRGRDAAIITLVDRPPASADTVATLRHAFQHADNSVWVVEPEFSGRHGHPIVVGREMIEAILQAAPSSTARDVLAAHRDRIQYVTVNDPLVVLNINTPEDYDELSSRGKTKAI